MVARAHRDLDKLVVLTCHCGYERVVRVNSLDWSLYHDGKILVQNAFPYLNIDDREMIVSHTCPNCWVALFSEDHDDDDDSDNW
jgi:hypothetical protein